MGIIERHEVLLLKGRERAWCNDEQREREPPNEEAEAVRENA
jgi:hypothetical protein